ncbi:TPA_exp: Uncharacterized protein A8136_0775 [Trichophyton benhamiae CBS 112371]|uniref:Cell wall protein n=1 Tax=Arthroderma benhamiae (strain ATCC MYA-4681 / CBS 112371) TaxID=663331 RepID=D4ATY1_ARTBC|nr:uncharacterized protein ARB_07794 [Trichophyton benhamiae CBS 112371]EFE33434.1 hypothetical protein ARB_07794 [Trichophyton benhamiae CBS 112371]DAA76461.1 TPA_exp: Uncharacterized protein A8136_0775 [Trichophyton benhamiae CBS 112371]
MLFAKYFTLAAAALAAQVTALPSTFSSVPEALGDLDPISTSIEGLSQRIAQSPGGITELMSITNDIYDVCDMAKKGRARFDGMAPFSKQEELEGRPHIERLVIGLTSAMDATSTKVPLIKAVPGGTLVAKRVAGRVNEEKTGFESSLQKKCSAEGFGQFKDAMDEFDKKFDALMAQL